MKRWLAMLILMAVLVPSAGAETFAVSYGATEERNGYALLLRDDGTPLTPAGTYQNIYAITPDGTPESKRLYTAEPASVAVDAGYVPREDEDYTDYYREALLDAEGHPLTEFDYVDLRWFAPGYVVFTLPDHSCGALDETGAEVQPARYADLRPTAEGWLALDAEGKAIDYADSYPIVFIDKSGERRDTGLHAAVGSLGACEDGICPVNGVTEYDYGAAYLDDRGNLLFGRSFDYAEAFVGGVAQVTEHGHDGLIDRSGNYVVEPKYDSINLDNTVQGPVFIGCADGDVCVYDDHGALMFTKSFDDDELNAWMINEAMLGINADGISHLYALDGKLLFTAPEERDINGWFNQGCDEAPSRLIDSVGEWPFQAARLVDLDGQPVGGSFQGLLGLIWRDGKGLYQTQSFRVTQTAKGEYIASWRTWRYGLCDQDGRVLLDSIYESMNLLSPDRLWVSVGSLTGMIDTEGKWYYTIDGYADLMD